MHNFIDSPAGKAAVRGLEAAPGGVKAPRSASSVRRSASRRGISPVEPGAVEASAGIVRRGAVNAPGAGASRAATGAAQKVKSMARAMVEGSPVASLVTDHRGLLVYANSAADVLLDGGCEDRLGQSLASVLDDLHRYGLEQHCAAICCGRPQPELKLVYRGLGESRCLRLCSQPLFREGACQAVVWSLYQLDDAVETLASGSVSAAGQRYQSLFQSAVIPQFVLDIRAAYRWACQRRVFTLEALQALLESAPECLDELRGRVAVRECNPAAVHLLGVQERSEDEGEAPCSDVLLRLAAQMAIAVLQGESQVEHAYDHVDGEGRARNMLALCALPAPDQLDDGVLISALDITELTETQADMHTRERFLSATLLALPDLLVVYDFEEDKPIFMNAALCRLLGYDWSYIESLGDRFGSELVHPDDSLMEADTQRHRRVLARGDTVERQLRLRHAGGDWKPFQSRTAALESRHGYCRIGVIVARDITEQMRVRAQIDQQEWRYKLLAENFSDIVCTTDENLNFTYISPSVEGMLGYRISDLGPKRMQLLLRNPSFGEMYRTLERDVCKARRSRCQSRSKSVDYLRVFEVELPHKNRRIVSLEVQCSLMWDESSELQGLLLVCRDVTQRAQLEADRRLAAKVFENSNEGIFITDREGRIAQINRAFTELTGYRQQDALGQRPSLLGSKTNATSFARTIKPALDATGYWQGELVGRRKNESEFHTAVGISAVLGKRGELLGYITSFEDITESKRTEERIRKLAYYDPLTGLPNRSLFQDRLARELDRAQRNDSYVALLFLDLDRFKSINDSMGHAAGDLLLIRVAERLGACVRGNDSISRMGGDEFTIILSELADRDNAVAASISVSRNLLKAFDEPIMLQGREVFLTASVGIAIFPDDANEATSLLQNADVAMYNAKQAGKNNFQFYLTAMNARALEKLELQNGLYRAAVDHDFMAMYQPIVDLRTGMIVAVETLLRWNHPVRGPIEPTEFVPVAEESGLIVRIGQWVLQEACQQMACWLAAGHDLQRIAVNISARQFAEGKLQQHVVGALEENGLAAHHLELELTESVLMDNVSYTMEVLNHLKSMGVELAIDDFGTGYSSLSYLKQFPIDRLKVDRAFVKGLASDREDQRIAQAIVAIAHSFNLSVVAEGVEHPEQEEFLRSLGCESVQGYLYGRPMHAAALTRLLEQQAVVAPICS